MCRLQEAVLSRQGLCREAGLVAVQQDGAGINGRRRKVEVSYLSVPLIAQISRSNSSNVAGRSTLTTFWRLARSQFEGSL